jgi:hypothetical protein
VPVYAVNLIITSAHEMWDVRWLMTHDLFFRDQRRLAEPVEQRSSHGMRISSSELGFHPPVLVASEERDYSRASRLIQSGSMLHAAADLTAAHIPVVDGPPRRHLAVAHN